MLPQSENSSEGMPGKILDETVKGTFQNGTLIFFKKSILHQWDRMTQNQYMN